MRNLGSSGRIFMLVLGIMVLGLYGALPAPWRYLALVGLLPFGSALTGYCPVRAWRQRRVAP